MANGNGGNGQDSGWGDMGGRPVFWDTNPDGSVNIFPGGMPRGHHDQMPHEHIIINPDGGVEFWRLPDGTIVNNYRG